ncbi:MAG: cell division protein SepF [Bacilli bacterium]|nr:cell division protein SepF [Bacilli bacterium]
MKLFKKTKKMKFNEYKNTRSRGIMTSYEKMNYFFIQDSSDTELFKIAKSILAGFPALVGLEKVEKRRANEVLAFLTGVVFAHEGDYIKMDEKIYLFAKKEEFEDGSLRQYVKDSK